MGLFKAEHAMHEYLGLLWFWMRNMDLILPQKTNLEFMALKC